MGWSVAGAGDVDGFGMPDIVVGLAGADTTVGYGGKASVYRGETETLQFTVSGTEGAGSLGYTVDGGDFNGDGLSDIVVGAYFQSNTAGVVRVFHGPLGAPGQLHVGAGT